MTSGPPRYSSPAARRTALEERLRQRANDTGTPLDRLRKEVTHQRLLARLVVVAPAGSWALKGGQALLAGLDTQARATKDAAATWRASLERFDDVLDAAVDTDLGDGFGFEVAAVRRSPYDTVGRQHSRPHRRVGSPHGTPTSATTTSHGAISERRTKPSHRSGGPSS